MCVCVCPARTSEGLSQAGARACALGFCEQKTVLHLMYILYVSHYIILYYIHQYVNIILNIIRVEPGHGVQNTVLQLNTQSAIMKQHFISQYVIYFKPECVCVYIYIAASAYI